MSKSSSAETIKEYGRGVVGGLIFSLPLIYTMEVWWTGFSASPEALICCILFTYLLLLGYNRFAGMRKNTTFRDLCWDSFEEIGLAFIVSFLFLLAISRITFDMSHQEIIGKIILESMIVAIGISVGTAQLGQESDHESGMGDDHREDTKTARYFKLIVLGFCGATLFAASVAPTEEIVMIAVECSNLHLIGIVLLSLFLCSVILFFSEFRGSGSKSAAPFEIVLTVLLSYLVSLIVAMAMLLFFGRITDNSFQVIVAQIIVLGLPAAIGASAGRLLIDGKSDSDE